MVAPAVPFTLSFGCRVADPNKGALIVIWLLGYKDLVLQTSWGHRRQNSEASASCLLESSPFDIAQAKSNRAIGTRPWSIPENLAGMCERIWCEAP